MSFQIRTGPAARDDARRLRKDMTEAEKRLWYRIRNRQLSDHQFRKQVPLGSYIADFCCLKERLVIELDGGQHAEITEHELKRRAWMEANGYRVLRFWNNEVFENIEGVLETIVRASKAPKIEL
jgi:very-short-patch-repair endonuclease